MSTWQQTRLQKKVADLDQEILKLEELINTSPDQSSREFWTTQKANLQELQRDFEAILRSESVPDPAFRH